MKNDEAKYKELLGYEPSEYQKNIFDFILHGTGNAVIKARAGSGKCLGVDTPVLMYDGNIKMVQDIVVGDLLMGDDSTPRKVLSTTVGYGKLYKIIPKKGNAWICNDAHVLTLANYVTNKYLTIDIPINQLLTKPGISNKHEDGYYRKVKLIKTGVRFEHNVVNIDPWLYGIWLGDGDTNKACVSTVDDEIIARIEKVIPKNTSIRVTNEKTCKCVRIVGTNIKNNPFRRFIKSSVNENGKFILKDYLINDENIRLNLLAGLIDSDGYYNNKNYYITTKSKQLANDILFLSRSLGFGAYSITKQKKCYNTGKVAFYHNITINGDIDKIPVILKRKTAEKRLINKSPLRVGFKIVEHGSGNYYGFTLDGNGRFLLGDFTITHNTATLITSMKLVPKKKRCLFLAFNRSVRDEIADKLVGQDNCDVMTVHGLGYRMIMANYHAKPLANDFKYSQFLKTNIRELSDKAPTDKVELDEYIERILHIVKFGRLGLCQTKNELLRVAVKHDIDFKFDEVDVALAAMEWGKGCVAEVDYTDMVWLPNELDLNPKQFKFDWIFNDEAQDYSEAYVKLFMRCFKRGTRFVSTGDDYQSINMFAGASATAFDEMINYKNTTLFTLPISYRCDRAIINEAKLLVDDIEPRPTAGPGIVVQNSHIRDINGEDMVLCRTNAPLVKMFTMLIDRNKPCYIKGKDDDKKRFIETVERFAVGEELGKDLNKDGLFPRLYDNMLEERNKRMLHGLDVMDAISSPSVQSKYDTITALLIIAKNCRTKTELVNRINSIFSCSNTGICLSTVHKAKGLESNNVHILCRSLMPSKSAKTKDEIQQENNLIYVAVTRAKHKLCYVSETEFPPAKAFDGDGDVLSEFKYIETKICQLYGKEPVNYMSDGEMAKFRLTSSSNTNIESNPIHKNDNAKTLSSMGPFERKKKSLLDNL